MYIFSIKNPKGFRGLTDYIFLNHVSRRSDWRSMHIRTYMTAITAYSSLQRFLRGHSSRSQASQFDVDTPELRMKLEPLFEIESACSPNLKSDPPSSHLENYSESAMSFRKRNIGLSAPRTPQSSPTNNSEPSVNHPTGETQVSIAQHAQIPGVRPSALDGRPTTSTGTPSLDALLAGHAGLALGNSILLEESGTTDYAGTLLRYYAAEGVVQGHQVHVIGVGEQWGRDLPGLVGTADGEERSKGELVENREKMKIAWRYERLGEFGVGGLSPSSRGGTPPYTHFIFLVYSSIMQIIITGQGRFRCVC